eukprot:PhF_6_TR7351/c0_g1_i1/m.11049/K00357/QDPR; dihydropteridine reductase
MEVTERWVKPACRFFAAKGWNVISADSTPNPKAATNLTLGQDLAITDAKIKSIVADLPELQIVFNAAGGWQGGNASSDSFIQSVDISYRQSVLSSACCASIASRRLSSKGVLYITGSAAALNPTAGMIGYGMAKAATHHLVKSLSMIDGGLPAGASAIGILPETLDTPGNRAAMPTADFKNWTPLTEVAWHAHTWALAGAERRPPTGSLAVFKTKNGTTTIRLEQ